MLKRKIALLRMNVKKHQIEFERICKMILLYFNKLSYEKKLYRSVYKNKHIVMLFSRKHIVYEYKMKG